MKNYGKLAVILLGIMLLSGTAQADNRGTVYTFCTVLLNENFMPPKGDSQWAVSSVFQTEEKRRKYFNTFSGFNADAEQGFSNFARDSLGGYVSSVGCSHYDSYQKASNERSDKIRGDRNSGEKVTTLQWSHRFSY
ncbi:hypothetical protein [Acinetobacter indicus]|uniref:hypothetical protein n=1 Tax=Acinetobacter indicus TaxID=756892 RepID=UPI001362931A|nr:hypothetical protein [Acinetobacter indicus]MDM1270268.1 hypothetical protein [Acinetobacter indicus]